MSKISYYCSVNIYIYDILCTTTAGARLGGSHSLKMTTLLMCRRKKIRPCSAKEMKFGNRVQQVAVSSKCFRSRFTLPHTLKCVLLTVEMLAIVESFSVLDQFLKHQCRISICRRHSIFLLILFSTLVPFWNHPLYV